MAAIKRKILLEVEYCVIIKVTGWGDSLSIRMPTWSRTLNFELWELLVGLRTAWTMGIKKLVAETDSQLVHGWINSREMVSNFHSNLVEECREMFK